MIKETLLKITSTTNFEIDWETPPGTSIYDTYLIDNIDTFIVKHRDAIFEIKGGYNINRLGINAEKTKKYWEEKPPTILSLYKYIPDITNKMIKYFLLQEEIDLKEANNMITTIKNEYNQFYPELRKEIGVEYLKQLERSL